MRQRWRYRAKCKRSQKERELARAEEDTGERRSVPGESFKGRRGPWLWRRCSPRPAVMAGNRVIAGGPNNRGPQESRAPTSAGPGIHGNSVSRSALLVSSPADHACGPVTLHRLHLLLTTALTACTFGQSVSQFVLVARRPASRRAAAGGDCRRTATSELRARPPQPLQYSKQQPRGLSARAKRLTDVGTRDTEQTADGLRGSSPIGGYELCALCSMLDRSDRADMRTWPPRTQTANGGHRLQLDIPHSAQPVVARC